MMYDLKLVRMVVMPDLCVNTIFFILIGMCVYLASPLFWLLIWMFKYGYMNKCVDLLSYILNACV